MNQQELFSAIMDYENDFLSEEEVIKLLQHLVNTGQAWTLQGSYVLAVQR